MAKGRTGESYAVLTASLDQLQKEAEHLKQTRKDLGRFLDIDKEKSELEALKIRKDEAKVEIDKMLIAARIQADSIKELARQAGDKTIMNAKEEANNLIENIHKDANKLTTRKAELDKQQKEIGNTIKLLNDERAAFVEAKKKLEQEKAGMKSGAAAFNELLKKFI